MEENAFDAMLDFQNMYRAYRRAAAGKRDKREVIEFELDLSRNLWKIIQQMEDKTYRVGGYHKFMIYDPKERKIEALSFRDRVVQHCLCDNILKPYFENRLIYDNAACREGKGTDFARDRLTGFLREHYKKHGTKGYILKYDIRHYFDSIDHEILKGMLKDIPDRNVLGLLYHIIRSYEGTTEPETGRKKGLPLGNQTSQWFALYYLDPVDRLIKERMHIKHYVRYMDDGVLIHESKEYLNEALVRMRDKAKELHLDEPEGKLDMVRTHDRHLPMKEFSKAWARIELDDTTTMRVDHNNVDIDAEMASMAKNQLYYNALATQLGGHVTNLKNVITSGGQS